MKIAHVIVGLSIGGAEQTLKRLLLADPDAPAGVLVVSLTTLGPIGEELRRHGFDVEALGLTGGASLPGVFLRLVRLLHRFRPDIVQTWMYHADIIGGVAARLAGCRNVVWGIRNTRVPDANLAQRALAAMGALLSHVVPRRIVSVSETGRTSYAAAGYAAGKIEVIPNGFDFVPMDRILRERAGRLPSRGRRRTVVRLACVGRFHPDKGQDILIAAAPGVLADHPRAQFVLIGRDCDERNAELLRLLQGHAVRERFVLLGERDDVLELLAEMDLFCLPSRTEGFPNGLAEAMAVGLPCVACDVGDVRVLAADTVKLVPAEDPPALARALVSLLDAPPEARAELGARAAARVRDHFTLQQARSRYVALYQGLAGGCA